MKNQMQMELSAISGNEGFARSTVAAFSLGLNPSLSELSDIRTAVSEAVTNCVVHAYKNKNDPTDKITLICETETKDEKSVIHIRIRDYGCGISDLEQAMQPFFTTLGETERSGMGFTIMQTFMDEFAVESSPEKGTLVKMTKIIGKDGVDA